MRIALSAGHNVYNGGYFDNGSSSGNYKEAAITKATVAILKKLLERQGHTVIDVTPYNQHFTNSKQAHQNRANKVNGGSFDLYLDIHINAGGGTGPEVLLNARNDISYKKGREIVNSINKVTGLRNRGVKNKPGFWSIAMVRCPAIIIEGGFIDSPGGKDMEILTPQVYAEAIASTFGAIDTTKEDKMVAKQRDYAIDGKVYKYKSINVDGTVYAPVREIAENLGFTVDSKGNKALINPRQTQSLVNGEETIIETVKVNKDTNYAKLEDLARLGIIKTDWIDGKVIIRSVHND